MNEENTKKLFERFEFFYPEKSIQESLMAFGFECGDGWFSLLWDLCEGIEKELKNIKKEIEYPFEVFQVKEKFGGLRFYTNWSTDEIYKLINEAEDKSYTICEQCGKPGTVRDGGWITTLCDECARKG